MTELAGVSRHNPIRVLWLIKGLGPGGAEHLLLEQAAVRDSRIVDYEVAYLMPEKSHLVAAMEELGVTTHCLDAPHELDVRWVPRFRQLVLRGQFDVVHAHSPVAAASARLAVRSIPAARRPGFLYTEHSRWPMYLRSTRIANRVTYGLNDHVVAVSEDVRDTIDARLRDSVEVLQHGIDLSAVRRWRSERDELRAEMHVGANEILAVTVANLRPVKGYHLLLDAARLVIDSGVSMRFVAAGQGPQEAELRAAQKRSGLGDSFKLLGYVPNAARLIAGADVFVLASEHEGLPVAVMEALALGIPVVAPAVGGLNEAVVSGESGLLVEPRTPEALALALERVADPVYRKALSAGARKRGDSFSIAPAVARLEEIYSALATRPR